MHDLGGRKKNKNPPVKSYWTEKKGKTHTHTLVMMIHRMCCHFISAAHFPSSKTEFSTRYKKELYIPLPLKKNTQ